MDDTDEARREYIDEDPADFVRVMLQKYPELADEYIQARTWDYDYWRRR